MATVVGPSALWYLTRASGAVTLVLLTLSVALGIADVQRAKSEQVPRFVVGAVHRSASLLALVFLIVHILTSVLDPFAPIRLADAVMPFVSAYRPVWLGLGAVASDLLLALAITSLLRHRFGYRAWRATHWLAYFCWPVALVHGLGTGSDVKSSWLLVLTAGSVVVVLAAVGTRIAAGWPGHIGVRISALAASIFAPLALLIWLPTGPLASGWAKRVGTPIALLAREHSSASSAAGSSSGTGVIAARAFTATATGTVSRSQSENGLARIDLRLTLAGQALSVLHIRLEGQPITEGGIEMRSSLVTLGTHAVPTTYRGIITALEGTDMQARLSGWSGGLTLLAQLNVTPASRMISGTVTTQP